MLCIKHVGLVCLMIVGQLSVAQNTFQRKEGVAPDPERGPVTIGFRLVNRLIVIPAKINGSDTLHFILDTGLENSIICELEADEVLELRQAREVQLKGTLSGEPAIAIHSTGNDLNVGNITLNDQDFIILPGYVLELSSKMGMKIHGMLNLQSFRKYILEIDYDRKLLMLYEPRFFRNHKNLDGYRSLPMEMQHSVPYVSATILIDEGKSLPVRLMLDTGAGNSLTLYTATLPAFDMPSGSLDSFLGISLNGTINGKVGRIKGIRMGPIHLTEVLVSYPDPQNFSHDHCICSQNGSLGAEFLRRFNMILDFKDHKIHITPGRAFGEAFIYDMSGLEIQAPICGEHRFVITGVRKQSNAETAGIRTGDELLCINGIRSAELSLDKLYRNLGGHVGKKIRLELRRQGQRIMAVFRLEKYI